MPLLSCLLLGLGLCFGRGRPAAQPAPPTPLPSPTCHRYPLTAPAAGQPGFTRLPPEITGVFCTNRVSPDALARNQILEIGSGVALGDVDGDGRVDLYFCSLESSNRLFRNLGNWTFADITAAAGVACPHALSTGAVFADTDGDGDLDLLVNSLRGGTRLFRNDGRGRFVDAAEPALQHPHGSTTLALADIDGDRWLDLYVATYRTNTIKDAMSDLDVRIGTVNGRVVVSPPGRFLPLVLKTGAINLFEVGEPDLLFRNRGGLGFERLSWTNGAFLDSSGSALTEPPAGWSLTAAFRDLNGDRAPDIYVCNDFFHSLDELWINDGSGRFRLPPPATLRHTSMSSMAVDFADFNRDGLDDFVVTDMLSREHHQRHRQRGSQIHLQMDLPVAHPLYRPEYPRNMLFLNRGDDSYAEIAQFSGIEATEWTWSVACLDVDLDGFEDLLITTGNLRDANDADLGSGAKSLMQGRFAGNLRFPRLETPDLAYRNRQDLTFEECGATWGFNTVGVSQAMALADLDNDGDLDVVVPTLDRPVGLFRNNASAPRIAVRLRGAPPNTQGIGARIVVHGAASFPQSQQVVCGGRYLSGDDPLRVFAAASTTNRLRIEVQWRDGNTTVIDDAPANHLYEIVEPTHPAPSPPLPAPSVPSVPVSPSKPGVHRPLFVDVSAAFKQPHHDTPCDDLEPQPSLPRRLSQLGPGIAWYDVDLNGTEDLLVGAGRGGFQTLFLNDGPGVFRAMRPQDKAETQHTTSLAWRQDRDRIALLVGTAPCVPPTNHGIAVLEQNPRSGAVNAIASLPASVGPLALGVHNDTPLLFAGGRLLPARYPEPASSMILAHRHGAWELDTNNTPRLERLGLVSGAVWTDIDGDAELDLVLACDWGPLRIFRSHNGLLDDCTQRLGLDRYPGCWNGVAAGDFDEDGRLDLVASNWGRNTPYQRFRARPLRLYFGDWTGAGSVDLLEAHFETTLDRYAPFPTLDRLRQTIPALAAPFASFADYARAGVDDILGEHASQARYLEIHWLESTVFLNRGDRFDPHPLPDPAQFAPAFGVAVGDLDGDGHEDLALAQNFFGVEPNTSRYDAGRGLILAGDGSGAFSPISTRDSGLSLDGEQRGCALADYDGDGRCDLAIGQNNGPTGLFHNVGATPGLRVRLRGPPTNPDGIGAVIRLKYRDRLGPARLVQAGSGYWSQNSVVQVLGQPEPAAQVWVRWPGGAVSVHTIPEKVLDLTVSSEP